MAPAASLAARRAQPAAFRRTRDSPQRPARGSPERRATAPGPGDRPAIGDGPETTDLRDLSRPMLALYIGGMGARGRNFYNDLAVRFGYEQEAAAIQDAYLDGRKDEAAGLVPASLLEGTSLIGPRSLVAERIAAMREAGVTTLNVAPLAATHADRVALIEQIRDLAG